MASIFSMKMLAYHKISIGSPIIKFKQKNSKKWVNLILKCTWIWWKCKIIWRIAQEMLPVVVTWRIKHKHSQQIKIASSQWINLILAMCQMDTASIIRCMQRLRTSAMTVLIIWRETMVRWVLIIFRDST